jgi:uncharacterized integral membrane protein
MRQQTAGDAGQGGIRITPRLVIGFVLLVLLVIFIAQNSERVDVTLYFWEFRMPLAIALVLAAVVGAVIGWLVPRFRPGSRR